MKYLKIIFPILSMVLIGAITAYGFSINTKKENDIIQLKEEDVDSTSQQNNPISSPISVPISTSIDEANTNIDIEKWLIYEHKQFPYYSLMLGFILYYPDTWVISEEKNDETSYLNITLSKDDASIIITQMDAGAGDCLYPEDPPEDSMAGRYGDFTDVEANSGNTYWRIAKPNNKLEENTYIVCEKRAPENRYNQITSIGWLEFQISPDDQTLWNEIIEILQRIDIDKSS